MTKTHNYIAYLMGAGLAIYSQQAALALFLGIGLALTVGPAPLSDASRLSRGALQSGVVILGLALPFTDAKWKSFICGKADQYRAEKK